MFKCNPLRWLWGLLPLALVWWVGTLDMTRKIEQDLAERANEHLARNNLSWASVSFAGRDGMLTGRAEEESDQRRPAIEVAKVWGVRTLEDRIEVLQFVKDYIWRASNRDGTLTLSGFIPNEAARKAVLASARSAFPKHKIEDQLDLARGAPEQKVWLGGTAFALRQLAALKTGGQASLEGAGLVLNGEADSSKGYETIRNELGRLPQGISLKTDRVVPPLVKPFTWSAQLRGRQIELSGHAPSVQARDQIKAAAAAAAPGGSVGDRMVIASGAPADWQKVASLALTQLGRLKQGSAEMIDRQLTVIGLTETEPEAETVRATLKKGTPSGYQLSEQVRQDPAVKAAEEARKAAEEAQREAARRAAADAEARRLAETQRQESDAQAQARLAEETARRIAENDARLAAEARRSAEDATRRAAADAEARRAAEEQARRTREEQDRLARAKSEQDARQRARLAEGQRCQRNLSAAVDSGTILFSRASADLDRRSHRTLNALAQIVKGCPGFAIEIAGHTDNEGEIDRNQRLSERRAQSVLDFLVQAGVPAATLSAVGYGQMQPRVPNDTPANMASNRRIELSVKPQ